MTSEIEAHSKLPTFQRGSLWWATYNATITGLHAGSSDITLKYAHECAVEQADMAVAE